LKAQRDVPESAAAVLGAIMGVLVIGLCIIPNAILFVKTIHGGLAVSTTGEEELKDISEMQQKTLEESKTLS